MTHGHEVEEEGRWGPHFRMRTNKKKEKGKEERGGTFPHLINSMGRIKRKERKEKIRKKRKKKREPWGRRRKVE